MGEVVSIVYKPKDGAASSEGYTRVPLREAQLVAGYGIEGDAKGGTEGRHLNIMSAESVRALAQEGFRAGPGQLGEQLALAGVAVDSLPAGTRIRIGATAVVEVTEPRTGCGKFEGAQDKRREEAAGRMGVMARVLTGGPIRVGDPAQTIDG